MQDQLQQLQNEIITLKARLFDTQENSLARVNEYNQVFATIAQKLGLSKEDSVNPESYYKAIDELVKPDTTPLEVVE